MRDYLKRNSKDFFWFLVGIIILAVAMNIFLIPNQIAAGGVAGLAIIVFYLFEIPIGLTIFLTNIPLFFLSWRTIGQRFILTSFIGAVLFSILIELTAFLRPVTFDLLLASIYGGILVGIGLGIIFRAQSSTGGTTLAARLLNHYSGFTMGQSLLIIDFSVIALALVFFNAEIALYALLSLFVTSKVTDLVQEGFAFSKAAFIISGKSDEIATKVLSDLQRGVTHLKATGAYTGKDKTVLLVVVNQTEVSRLKVIVHDIDSDAFVVISSASEVLGEGFKRRKDKEIKR